MNAPLSLPALDEIRAHEAEMVEIRRRIHQNPELAYEEHATSDLVAERLTRWGYEVHRGLGGTGVVGTLRAGTSARRIGLRADMDALPIAETSGKPWASKVFGKMLEEQIKPTAKDEAMQKTVAEICRSLPDFTYTVTIDTEKNLLTDVHANLTEPIRKAASIIVKRRDLPRSERDKLLKDIRESTVDFHLQGRDFNELEDVQVPAEVLANAKATELPLGD